MKLKQNDLMILRALKARERMARREIINATGIHASTVAYRLDHLLAARYIIKPIWGIYEITEKGKKAVWRRGNTEE